MLHNIKYVAIVDFERYTIDLKGRIYDKKLKRFKRHRIMSKKGRNKVVVVDLIRNNKKVSVQLKNIVAKHFCKNPNNYDYVYQKDNNILNCNAWNLVYLDLSTINQLKNKKQYKGGRNKIVLDKKETINFIENLKKKTIDEINILKFYKNPNMKLLWDIFQNNYEKMLSKANNDTLIVDEAFDYYIDRVNRYLTNNYQSKILLDCVRYEKLKSMTAKQYKTEY